MVQTYIEVLSLKCMDLHFLYDKPFSMNKKYSNERKLILSSEVHFMFYTNLLIDLAALFYENLFLLCIACMLFI